MARALVSSYRSARHTDAPRLDLDAHALARAHGDLPDVGALGTRRLRLHHGVDERFDVLDQLLVREARLAHTRLHDAGLLDAELDRPALGTLHGAGDIH